MARELLSLRHGKKLAQLPSLPGKTRPASRPVRQQELELEFEGEPDAQ